MNEATSEFFVLQDRVVAVLKEAVEDFKEVMPMVEELHNPALKARHWATIMDLIGADEGLQPTEEGTIPEFSVTDLLGYNLVRCGSSDVRVCTQWHCRGISKISVSGLMSNNLVRHGYASVIPST